MARVHVFTWTGTTGCTSTCGWTGKSLMRLQTEVERLISLGATRVDWDYPEGADFVVLADTEGNLFCVIA